MRARCAGCAQQQRITAGTPVDPKPYVPTSFSGIPAAVFVLVVMAVRPRMARSKLLGYFNSLAEAREIWLLSRVWVSD